MIGIWLFTPFLTKIKFTLGEKTFEKFSIFWLVFAALSNMTCSYETKWNMGLSCNFLGYYFIGSVIYSKKKKNNKKGAIFILFGFLVELIALLLRVEQIKGGIENELLNKYLFNGWFSPFYLLTSILIFYGFSMLTINRKFSKAAKYMFYVYLFHAGIITVLQSRIFNSNKVEMIPILVVIVFICSYICSVIYDKIYKIIEVIFKKKG